MDLSSEDSSNPFLKEKHVKFCLRSLAVLPHFCSNLDSNRLPAAFFAISGLDILGAISELDQEKNQIIEWLYSLQVLPEVPDDSNVDCGFRGSTTCSVDQKVKVCDKPHIASTYSALSCLLILGDDLSRVEKKNVILSIKKLQLPDGCYRAVNKVGESDMRYLFCAACICYILHDWSGIDIDRALNFIRNSLNYDGGIAQGPGLESHAGFTYCAIASLSLMGKLDTAFTPKQLKSLKRWLVHLQSVGFHGRPNKPDDTCYSFWAGASLKMLNCYNYFDYPSVLNYVLSAQDPITGGIGKFPYESVPDLLHTYLSISGLSLKNDKLETSVSPALNISQRAANHLLKLHKEWDNSR